MLNRREFIKKTACAGVGLFVADSVLSPLSALAYIDKNIPTSAIGGTVGLSCLLDSTYHVVIIADDPPACKVYNLLRLTALYERRGDVIKGVKILNEAADVHRTSAPWDIETRYAITEAFIDIGQKNSALERTYEALRFSENGPNIIEMAEYARLLNMMGERDHAESLINEADEINRRDLFPLETLHVVINLFKLGLYERAEERVLKLPPSYERQWALMMMAEGYAEQGWRKEASVLMQKAFSSGTEDISWKASEVCAKLGNWQMAMLFANRLPFPNCQYYYLCIGKLAVAAGDMEISSTVLNSALRDIGSSDYWPTFSLLPEIAEQFLLMGNKEQACSVIDKYLLCSEAENTYPAPSDCVSGLCHTAGLFLKMNKGEEALDLLNRAFRLTIEMECFYKSESILMPS